MKKLTTIFLMLISTTVGLTSLGVVSINGAAVRARMADLFAPPAAREPVLIADRLDDHIQVQRKHTRRFKRALDEVQDLADEQLALEERRQQLEREAQDESEYLAGAAEYVNGLDEQVAALVDRRKEAEDRWRRLLSR